LLKKNIYCEKTLNLILKSFFVSVSDIYSVIFYEKKIFDVLIKILETFPKNEKLVKKIFEVISNINLSKNLILKDFFIFDFIYDFLINNYSKNTKGF
jgi:hypothetical protein